MELQQFGKRLRKVRNEREFSIDALAEKASIGPAFLRKMETGEKLPSMGTLIHLCNALQISPEFLLKDDLKIEPLKGESALPFLWRALSPKQSDFMTYLLKAMIQYFNQQTDSPKVS